VRRRYGCREKPCAQTGIDGDATRTAPERVD
jgi:hypothetical protein